MTCPTYVFLLNATFSFKTPDQRGRSTTRIIANFEVEMDVHDAHFEEFSTIHSNYQAGLERIEDLEKSNDRLARQQVLLSVGQTTIHYKHALSYSATAAIVLRLFYYIYMLSLSMQFATLESQLRAKIPEFEQR